MRTKKQIENDLGPENAEARHLMNVLQKVVDTSQHSKLEEDYLEDDEFTNTGIGKDQISKYSFAEVEVEGKEYFVTIRDKKQFDKATRDTVRHLSLSDPKPTENLTVH